MSKKIIITESQFGALCEGNLNAWRERGEMPSFIGKRAYHVVGRRPGEKGNVLDIARKIYHEGLTLYNNGEVGSVIWFWVGEPFYEKGFSLMFSIDITPENYEKFDMSVSGPNMWAEKPIPFEYLNVELAPAVRLGDGRVLTNEPGNLRLMAKGFSDNFESWACERPVTVFTDIVPKDLVDRLDPNSPNVRFDKLFR